MRSAAVTRRAEWPARIAWWTRFLASRVLPSPCAATMITFSRCTRKSSVKTRSTVGRWSWVGELFEQDDGTPAFLRGARDQIVELGRGVAEPQLAQVITQRRRDRVG